MCFSLQHIWNFRHRNFRKWSAPAEFCTFWLWNVLLAKRRAIFPHLNFKKWSENAVFCTFWLWNVLLATMTCHFCTSELQKVVRECRVLFSLQRRATFRHRNFKKWSAPGVFCTFWLGNVLLATAACNFSTSQLQKAVRPWGVLHILTWKCASRYSGVQFFHIAPSKSGPNMQMRFAPQRRAIFLVCSEQLPPHPPLYRGYFSTQPTHKSLKNTAFRDFPIA